MVDQGAGIALAILIVSLICSLAMKRTIPELKSKFMGAMVGSAVGDAIGELAFSHPDLDRLRAFLEETGELRYTDDTAMAIGLAESLVERRAVDQHHLGKTFSRNFFREPWRGYASGPPSIFSAVEKLGISYPEAAGRIFGGEGSLGNGAAMRIAPLGVFLHQAEDLYEQAAASAAVTHAHPVGKDGAAALAFAVAQAVTLDPGEPLFVKTFIRNLIGICRTHEVRSKMETLQELFLEDTAPPLAAARLGRTVAVHESMPFALYAFLRHHGSFEKCLFCAVLNGGDRDTLGAMACAISGAFLGVEAVPDAWKELLENRIYIEKLAADLAEICHSL